ncbi:MAG TPA: helix-turn-helix domain-containing protein [Mycobacteriales bacterium]|nr:helix-turn-helix domain-containing protein [Mycobacteriales bacterium]
MSALLSVDDVATELGTPVRFVRRLIQERRIRFHKIGKYVRISRHDLEAFVAAAVVDPLPSRPGGSGPGRNGPNLPLPVARDA